MLDELPEWFHQPCYYVAGAEGNRTIFLLAGPYPTSSMAWAVLDKAREWAIKESGDQGAAGYEYTVEIRAHGHARSRLGIIKP